jgi:hypothetical protein
LRLFLLLIVALGLAPGTWLRSTGRETPDERQILTFTPLRIAERKFGEIEVAGAWRLSSPNWHFAGYSALLATDEGGLLAVTDWGRMLRMTAPDARRPAPPRFGYFATLEEGDKHFRDIEAVTRDPATGRIWGAYESSNLIERYDARLRRAGRVAPAAMHGWPSNTGPESIVRLRDGRFVVLSEGSTDWFAADLPALIFPGDPVEGAEPLAFRYRPPEGYRPVDTALLPDGRVLILLRRLILGLPPRFESKLVVADPAEIRPGERWRGREIAHLADPAPTDNYEGVAVAGRENGALVLWLISDDNKATFQSTLLLKLLWRPGEPAEKAGANEKARELPRAPS